MPPFYVQNFAPKQCYKNNGFQSAIAIPYHSPSMPPKRTRATVEEEVDRDDMKAEMRCASWKDVDEIKVASMKRDWIKRDLVDHDYQQTPHDQKWAEIAADMSSRGEQFSAKRVAKKWDNMVSDFKKIFRYQTKSGAQDWWTMSTLAQKKETGIILNKMSFCEELYVLMASFLGDRPTVNGNFVVDSSNKVDCDKKIKVEANMYNCSKKRKQAEEPVNEDEKVIDFTEFLDHFWLHSLFILHRRLLRSWMFVWATSAQRWRLSEMRTLHKPTISLQL